MPAIGTTLLGVLAGWWVRDGPSPRLIEPFVALGRNAILLFVQSGLIAKTLIYVTWPAPATSLGPWIYTSAFTPFAPPHVAYKHPSTQAPKHPHRRHH